MSNLKYVGDDEVFNSLLKSVGDDLTVIDFYTTWCGPCKQMEPVLQSLSMKYPRILFLKVDADKCFETAMRYDVRGVPLFVIYMNKEVVDQVAGAHPQELDRKLKQYEQMHRQNNPSFSNVADHEVKSLSQVISSIGKVQDVTPFLEEKECYCMNDLTPSAFDGFLGGKKLVSGKGSGKLVLVYSFKQKLMLHSFKIRAKVETGPKVLRLFANHPKQIDFSLGTKIVPSQQIILLPEDLNGDRVIEFRTGNFTLVSNLQIFVTEPMTKGHRMEIESLTIFGAPVEMMKRPSKPNISKIAVTTAQSTSTNSEEKNPKLISTGTEPGTPVHSSPSNANKAHSYNSSLTSTPPAPEAVKSSKPEPHTLESKWKNNLISQVEQYIDKSAPVPRGDMSSVRSSNSSGGKSSLVVQKSKTSSQSTTPPNAQKQFAPSEIAVSKLAGAPAPSKSVKNSVTKDKKPGHLDRRQSSKVKSSTTASIDSQPRKGILRPAKPDPHANHHQVIEDALANTTTSQAPTESTSGTEKRIKKRSISNTRASGKKGTTRSTSRARATNAAGGVSAGTKTKRKRVQPGGGAN